MNKFIMIRDRIFNAGSIITITGPVDSVTGKRYLRVHADGKTSTYYDISEEEWMHIMDALKVELVVGDRANEKRAV